MGVELHIIDEWYGNATELVPLLDQFMPPSEQGAHEGDLIAGEHAAAIEDLLNRFSMYGLEVPDELQLRLRELESLIPADPDSPMAKYQAATDRYDALARTLSAPRLLHRALRQCLSPALRWIHEHRPCALDR